MKITGLDQLSKKLDRLSKNAAKLDGEHSVAISDVLTPKFISKNTNYSNVNEFFSSGGFEFENQEEFEAIPQEQLDAYVQAQTTFESWQDMIGSAARDWAISQLGL